MRGHGNSFHTSPKQVRDDNRNFLQVWSNHLIVLLQNGQSMDAVRGNPYFQHKQVFLDGTVCI